MKILITGTAGFIGSHTAERLQAMGHQVIGWDNFSNYYDVALKEHTAKTLENKGVVMQRVDLFHDDLASIWPEDLDYVFHFAAQPGISASSSFTSYLENNFIATQRLLSVLEQLEQPPYMVNIATSSVYGLVATKDEFAAPEPASWYGVTKLAAEQLVLAYVRRGFIQWTSLRLYSVYGPRERPDKLYTRLIDCGLNQKEFSLYQGSEQHRRSFTYVGDIVDGIVSVLNAANACNGEIINLGSDVEHSTGEGIQTVERLLGTEINKQIMPPRPGDQDRTMEVIDKAKRLLDYSPKTSLEEGLKVQIAWFKTLS
ncbi:MAG TPA: 3-beta hydroxysteroid dehydrogenase [Flavobacteriaceae bacterium]|nr:3-beta hydroxysteroid dehydrogenase [Flavobacteriaceae bacterium]